MGFLRCATTTGLVALTMLTLTGCADRPFTRDDARAVPGSVIQIGEYQDKDWEYVDQDGVAQRLNRCEKTSIWVPTYSCTSPDGTVELTFNHSKRGMKNATLHTGNGDVPLKCIRNDFRDGRRLCMPDSAVPEPVGASAT